KEEEVMEVEMNEFDVKMEELNNEFSAHPNPFSTSTAVSLTLSKGGAYLVALYDSRGAKVADLQQGLAVPGEKIALEVDGAGMAKGVYLLMLHTSIDKPKIIRLILN